MSQYFVGREEILPPVTTGKTALVQKINARLVSTLPGTISKAIALALMSSFGTAKCWEQSRTFVSTPDWELSMMRATGLSIATSRGIPTGQISDERTAVKSLTRLSTGHSGTKSMDPGSLEIRAQRNTQGLPWKRQKRCGSSIAISNW